MKKIILIAIFLTGVYYSLNADSDSQGETYKKIRVSTICLAIPDSVSISKQVNDCLEEAGKLKSDIVCIPESFSTERVSDEKTAKYGKTAEYIIEKAKKYQMYIIAPMREKADKKIYNTSFVFNRKGEIVGKYRKSHLGGGEEKPPNIYPGDDLPVIETDFGKIGILTCHDMNFMEICRVYMLKGAEIVFWPTMWGVGTAQKEEYFFLHIRSQAILNGLYIVPSNYAWIGEKQVDKPLGNSSIVDPNGNIIATTGLKGGLATAEIVLYKSLREYKDGQDDYDTNAGIRRQAIKKERRPELYGIIAK